MTKVNRIKIQCFLALTTLGVLFASLYFQYVVGLQPCPLCLMQRFCVFLLLLLCFLGIMRISERKGHIVNLLQIIVSFAGLYFSLRQLWLWTLPAGKAPACMPGLDILIHYFPWQAVARALFWGAGDCAESTWSMLGIPMPGWSALYFLFMGVLGIFLYRRRFITEQRR